MTLWALEELHLLQKLKIRNNIKILQFTYRRITWVLQMTQTQSTTEPTDCFCRSMKISSLQEEQAQISTWNSRWPVSNRLWIPHFLSRVVPSNIKLKTRLLLTTNFSRQNSKTTMRYLTPGQERTLHPSKWSVEAWRTISFISEVAALTFLITTTITAQFKKRTLAAQLIQEKTWLTMRR